MLRLLLAMSIALLTCLVTVGESLADALVTVGYDGTGRLDLIGTGWNPNDRVVILVNSQEVTVTADASGGFEVPAPLPAPGEVGFKLSWRREQDQPQANASLAQTVLLPVLAVTAGLLVVVAAGMFAARRAFGAPRR
jgi:hypothetical protein